jgi:hypothetical protein
MFGWHINSATIRFITALTKNLCTEFKGKESTAPLKIVSSCQQLALSPGAELSVSSQHSTTHSATALRKD